MEPVSCSDCQIWKNACPWTTKELEEMLALKCPQCEVKYTLGVMAMLTRS